MSTTVRSYAKVNLGLAIGPVREDGFHGLLTLYQTLALHDLVTVAARRLPVPASRSRISLTSSHARVPCDARNTAWRMVDGALERMGVIAEVCIHIEKRLPIQGGMGAGSANAAAALIALERELALELPRADRLALAADVGSDVPLFLIGGTVLGTGRGEQVEEVSDLPATACVVALPELGVSTPRAFRDWDSLQETVGLTSPPRSDTFEKLSSAYSSVFRSFDTKTGEDRPETENTLLSLVRNGIENDFEQVVFSQHPTMRDIKRQLTGIDPQSSAVYAALSGSGSALFGLYTSVEVAQGAQQRLQSSGITAFLTETLPRELYWGRMFAESSLSE